MLLTASVAPGLEHPFHAVERRFSPNPNPDAGETRAGGGSEELECWRDAGGRRWNTRCTRCADGAAGDSIVPVSPTTSAAAGSSRG
jgi:hypothetical protein